MADADPDCAGLHAGFPSFVIPLGVAHSFEEELLTIIKDNEIDFVVPGVDEELVKFWKIKTEYPAVELVMPSEAFTSLCLQKDILMAVLGDKRISGIPTYSPDTAIFPIVAKPKVGRGSRHVHKIDTAGQLDAYFTLYNTDAESTLLQQYVDGDEYTVSVIVNNRNRLIGIVPKRIIVKRGITRIAISQKNEMINDACVKIISELTPSGPFNVQLMLKDNTVHIFEINPRISTTCVLTDYVYANEVDLFVENFEKDDVLPNNDFDEGIVMARHEEAVFYKKQGKAQGPKMN